jgi:hypothetical protein
MAWEIQKLVGYKKVMFPAFGMKYEGGSWESLRPLVPDGAPPYRYEDKEDAQRTLDALLPSTPTECKRVVFV